MRISTKAQLALAAIAATSLLSAAPAFAAGGTSGGGGGSGDGGGNSVAGHCSLGATWKLKAQPDNGRIRAEFEVDGIRPGRTWQVTLMDNGTTFFSGKRMADNSDSFKVEVRTANRPGPDTIRAEATNLRNGQTCRGKVTI